MEANRLIRSALLVVLGAAAEADGQVQDSRPVALAAGAAEAAGPSDAASNDARLGEIIEQVRLAEERYRTLETFIRTTLQDEVAADANARQNAYRYEETSYTLQQADLFLFKWRQVQTQGAAEPIVSEQVAAFDGETTRLVLHGNCVNVFAGRHEPNRLCPPHTWCLRTLWVNYPLSVYLQGTEAIHKHPKSFKSPAQRGRVFEVARVDVSYAGEESVDGLDCVKLQSRHWVREMATPQITEAPQEVTIWLARDRGYLCAEVAISLSPGFQGTRRNETKVTEWSEIEPGLWLPKQIQTTHHVIPPNGGKEEVRRRESVVVEKASAEATHPNERFAELKPPDGLPIYRFDRDGFVEGSTIRSVKAPAGDPQELARIIAELKRQEERCPSYDASTTLAYHAFEARRMPGATITSEARERTISLPGKLYHDHVEKRYGTVAFASVAPGVQPPPSPPSETVSRNEGAWDGEWTRISYWNANKDELPIEPTTTGLHKGGPKGLNAFRPHTALFSDDRIRRRSLSDFLTAEYWDEQNKSGYLVEYLGEEEVDGLRCARLRLGALFGDEKEPRGQFLFLWLARERNYLPVRSEQVDLAWSDRIPTGMAYVDDLHEVAPGLWFPYHVVEVTHDSWGGDGSGSGQVVVNWRRECRVDSLDLEPEAPDDLFAPAVAANARVFVTDGLGNQIGSIRQRERGVPGIAPDRFAVMEEIARVDRRDRDDQRRRQAAQDALLGTPLPEFDGGTWLNGPPQTTQSLAGKVLLVEFWAEWWQPSENDLKNLAAANRGLAADGVTVLSVHAAGSDRRDIEDFADEARFDGPIYIDVARPDATNRWGGLFEKLAVRELPHAFVVDRQGKIVAHGRLDKMITRARAEAAGK